MKSKVKLFIITTVVLGLFVACGSSNQEVDNTESLLNSEISTEEALTEATEEIINTESLTEEVETPAWTVTDMDKTMYAKSTVNVRKGPDASYEKIGSLSTNDEVKVTGKCNEYDWYRIEFNGEEAYVSASYLLDEKVVVNNPSSGNATTNNASNVYSEPVEESSTPDVPLTPEPAIGTIVFDGYPQDGYIWLCVDVVDNYISVRGWSRGCIQGSFFAKEYPQETLRYYADQIYPLPTEPGEYECQKIEYPTFWIYLGDGFKGYN